MNLLQIRFSCRLVVGLSGLAAAAVATAVPMPQPRDYEGLKIIEVDVPDADVVQFLLDQGLSSLACTPVEGPSPWLLDETDLAMVDSLGMANRELVGNLPEFIGSRNAERRTARAMRGGDFYADFRTLEEFNAKLDELILTYPDVVTPVLIGTSYEGRPIRGVVIRRGPDNGRPAVVFNGCQHAREWISPMTTMFIAEELLSEQAVDSATADLLTRLEVIVIPVINPDGYVFTYEPGGNRYWRKNREPNAGNTCVGTDLNRNWGDSFWNCGSSTSTDPCSDVYVGSGPNSSPEVAAYTQFLLAHGNIKAQIDFHAFSELILEPYGYTAVNPPDYDVIHGLGLSMQAAIQNVYGRSYVTDSPCEILYCACGTAIDWPYEQYGSLAYTIELRPGSGGLDGFNPPPSEIRPCAEENYQAAKAMLEWVALPVSFEFPTGIPSIVSTTTTTTFPVRILSRNETPVASTARIAYRGDNGEFIESPLVTTGPALSEFEATLPAFACADTPEFYLLVEGNEGGQGRFPASSTEVLVATPISQSTIVFDDNGESDPGWTVSGSATDGGWTRGVPIGGGVRGDPPNDADGSGSCWLTDNVEGNSDVDGGEVILTSPTLDISEPGLTLAYSRWFSNDSGGSPNEDRLVVNVSSNNGLTWVPLEVVGPAGPDVSGGWVQVEFSVDTLPVEASPLFRIQFIAEDIGAGSVVEAGIDAIRLFKLECIDENGCVGDVVGDDQVVDVNDLLGMLAAFGGSDPAFDIDGNGAVDVNDLLAVLAEFGQC